MYYLHCAMHNVHCQLYLSQPRLFTPETWLARKLGSSRIRGAATASSGAGQSQVIRGSQSVKSGRGGRTGHGGSDTLGWRRLRVFFVLPRTEERESDENVFVGDVRARLTSKANRSEFTPAFSSKNSNNNHLTRQKMDK